MLAAHFGVIPIVWNDEMSQSERHEHEARIKATLKDFYREFDRWMMDEYRMFDGGRPYHEALTDLDSYRAWGEEPDENLTEGIHVLGIFEGMVSGPENPLTLQHAALPGDWDVKLVDRFALMLQRAIEREVPGFTVNSTYHVSALRDFSDVSRDLTIGVETKVA